MPRGKKGPYPQMEVTSETGVQVVEESFLPEDDKNIEDIIGKENVESIDEGDRPPLELAHLKCGKCAFRTHYLSEMEEHYQGTGHGGLAPEEPAQQAMLPNLVHREITIPLDEEFLVGKRFKLATLYQAVLEVKDEKKAADDEFNAKLKSLDNQMQEIARVLKAPVSYKRVDCEWRIIEEENARGLFRLDTGECIEKEALSIEDHEQDIEQAIVQAEAQEKVDEFEQPEEVASEA